jgi:hypothetical protein
MMDNWFIIKGQAHLLFLEIQALFKMGWNFFKAYMHHFQRLNRVLMLYQVFSKLQCQVMSLNPNAAIIQILEVCLSRSQIVKRFGCSLNQMQHYL